MLNWRTGEPRVLLQICNLYSHSINNKQQQREASCGSDTDSRLSRSQRTQTEAETKALQWYTHTQYTQTYRMHGPGAAEAIRWVEAGGREDEAQSCWATLQYETRGWKTPYIISLERFFVYKWSQVYKTAILHVARDSERNQRHFPLKVLRTTRLDYKLHTGRSPAWRQETMGERKGSAAASLFTYKKKRTRPHMYCRMSFSLPPTPSPEQKGCTVPMVTAACKHHRSCCSSLSFTCDQLRLFKDLRILNSWWGTQKAKNSWRR